MSPTLPPRRSITTDPPHLSDTVYRKQVEKTSPYFEVQPPSGTLLGDQDTQLLVRFCPKAMGRHVVSLPVRVFGAGGKVIQEVLLHLSGTSLRQGAKVPLVGGPERLPGDFAKPNKFTDDEQVGGGRGADWGEEESV